MRKTSDVLWQDTQHQVLFKLLDQVGQQESGTAVLFKLRFYAESHFALEEIYMRKLAYPGRREHESAHNKFRGELTQMLQQAADDDPVGRQIISTFLTEWLTRHVFGIDKELECFLLESGVR
jgi:hemerythrin